MDMQSIAKSILMPNQFCKPFKKVEVNPMSSNLKKVLESIKEGDEIEMSTFKAKYVLELKRVEPYFETQPYVISDKHIIVED